MLSKTVSNFVQSNNALGKKLFNIKGKHGVFSPTSITYLFSILHLASA